MARRRQTQQVIDSPAPVAPAAPAALLESVPKEVKALVPDSVDGVAGAAAIAQASRQDASDRLALYREIEIDGQDTLAIVADELGSVKGLAKRLRVERDKAVKPLNAALSAIRGWFRPAEDALEECESTLKAKIAAHRAAVDASNAAAVEAVREAVEVGDGSLATEALAEIQDPAHTAGVSVTEVWNYRVCNIGMVPSQYVDIVPSKVRAEMLEQIRKGLEPVIPGITFFREQRVSARAK